MIRGVQVIGACLYCWVLSRYYFNASLILRKVEERGAVDTAHRLRQTIGQVFRYGVATGRCDLDPTPSLRGALQTLEKKNYPVPSIESVGGILRAIGALDHGLLRIALQLATYTVPRSNEIISSRWPEIGLKARIWTVPASRMKHRQEHVVYLSDQAVELLETLYGLTGAQEFLFPGNRRNRPIVGATLVSGLRRAGVGQDEMVVHSFRGIFLTICNERLNVNYDVIEKCLAHKDRDQVRAAYNRASYVEQRRELMQAYADYLDGLRDKLERC